MTHINGVNLIGSNINIPKEYYDYSNLHLTSGEVNTILQGIDSGSGFEITWRVISIGGNNAPITDSATYDSLISKGYIIYGNTVFAELLSFSSINEDYIDFGIGKTWISDYQNFEIEVEISDLDPIGTYGIIGQSRNVGNDDRWGIAIVDGRVGYYSGGLSVDDILSTIYPITSGIIKVTCVNGFATLYIDDIAAGSTQLGPQLSMSSTGVRMVVGAYNDADGITTKYYSTVKIHYAKITSGGITNILSLNEGIGNIVMWSEGDVGTIKTSNVNGISYINDTMWQ